MKKVVLIIVAAVVIVGGGVGIALKMQSNEKSGSTVAKSEFTPPKACDILSEKEAAKVVGGAVEQVQAPASTSSMVNPNVELTQCQFNQSTNGKAPDLQTQKQVTLTVHGAKTKAGGETNAAVFGANRPKNVVEVKGYGEMAFWKPDFGQLNIYRNRNWYVISVGTIDPKGKTLDDAKKLADSIATKL